MGILSPGRWIAALLLALAVAQAAAQAPAPAAPQPYAVDYAKSWLLAVTGKSGLLSFAGHNHAVLATKWTATANFNAADPAHSTASITIPVASLVIDSDEARRTAKLGEGPKPEDVRTIQQRMQSAEVLNAARYPEIRFSSESVEPGGAGRLRLRGQLELHGTKRAAVVPVRYREGADGMEFDGEFTIRQTDFGMTPETVGGGTIKVKDEVTLRFHIVLTGTGNASLPHLPATVPLKPASLRSGQMWGTADPAPDPRTAATHTLKIVAEGVRSAKGVVGVLVFQSAQGWPESNANAVRAKAVAAHPGAVTVAIPGLPDGNYAVVVLHDENENRKLDKSWVGKPEEQWGMSNNPPVHLSAPGFEQAEFALRGDETIRVKLR